MHKIFAILYVLSATLVCMQPEHHTHKSTPSEISSLKDLAIQRYAVALGSSEERNVQDAASIAHLPELYEPLKREVIKRYRSAFLNHAFNDDSSITCEQPTRITIHNNEVFVKNKHCTNRLLYDEIKKRWILQRPLNTDRNSSLYSQNNELISIHYQNQELTFENGTNQRWGVNHPDAILYGITETELLFKANEQIAILDRNDSAKTVFLSAPLDRMQCFVVSSNGRNLIAKTPDGAFLFDRNKNRWNLLNFLPSTISSLHKVTDDGLLLLSQYTKPTLWNIAQEAKIWTSPKNCHLVDMNNAGTVYGLAHGYRSATPLTLINLDAYTLEDLIGILSKK